MEIVHQHFDKWWFWNEIFSYRIGPYDSPEEAEEQMFIYQVWLDDYLMWDQVFDVNKLPSCVRNPDSCHSFIQIEETNEEIRPMNAAKEVLLASMNPSGSYTVRDCENILNTKGINISSGGVRRALGRLLEENLVAKKKIPKDRYGRKQWEMTRKGSGMAITINLLGSIPQNTSTTTATSGVSDMCNKCHRGPQPTLEKAVEHVLTGFMILGKQFSAHDVTKQLRDDVAYGVVTVDPKEVGGTYTIPGGQEVPAISHTDVKSIVHKMFRDGDMPGYDRKTEQDHWVYYKMTNDPSDDLDNGNNDDYPYDGDDDEQED